MGLKVKDWKANLPKIFGIIIAVIIGACLVKVLVWEHDYYKSKEGQERQSIKSLLPASTIDVDETDLTAQDIIEYKVGPDRPRYLTIEKIGVINARMLEVGVTTDGSMQVPASIYDTGWYGRSGKPGQGGTLLADGHNGGPTKTGVFKQLPNLVAGDIIKVERGDGAIFEYSVVDSEAVPLSEADDKMSKIQESPEPGVESISLISCTGEWSHTKQTYLSRQFVRAKLVNAIIPTAESAE